MLINKLNLDALRKHLKGDGDKKKLWFQITRSESTEEMPALSLAPTWVSRIILAASPSPASPVFCSVPTFLPAFLLRGDEEKADEASLSSEGKQVCLNLPVGRTRYRKCVCRLGRLRNSKTNLSHSAWNI